MDFRTMMIKVGIGQAVGDGYSSQIIQSFQNLTSITGNVD
jgi:hypothetical protein